MCSHLKSKSYHCQPKSSLDVEQVLQQCLNIIFNDIIGLGKEPKCIWIRCTLFSKVIFMSLMPSIVRIL